MTEEITRLIALVIAVVPAFVIFAYFLAGARVSLSSEHVWRSVGIGAATAFPAMMMAMGLQYLVDFGTTFYQYTLSDAFLGAAIPEELAKIVAIFVVTSSYLRELKANQLFAISVGVAVGFAAFENILYVVGSEQWGGIAFFRSISAVPGHAFTGAVMGYCVMRAARSRSIWQVYWWGACVVWPIALHGAYDVFAMGLTYSQTKFPHMNSEIGAEFVFLFAMVMILEGVLAHICLRWVVRDTGGGAGSGCVGNKLFADHVLNSAMLWGLCAIICFVFGLIFAVPAVFDGMYSPSGGDHFKGHLVTGFSVVALFHGVAFLALAYVLRQRRKVLVAA